MAGVYLDSPTQLLPLADVDTAPIEMPCPRCGGEVKSIDLALPPPDHVMLNVCMRSRVVVSDEDRRPLWEYCAAACVRELVRRLVT